MIVQHVPVEFVAQTWPLVEKHIASAEKFGGDDYTADQIKVYLAKNLWTLLVAVDENKQPAPVPTLVPATDEEKRRWQAALIRKDLRRELAQRFEQSRVTASSSVKPG